jgi:hypothetical protein
VAIGEVDRAISKTAGEALFEFDPPAGVTLLGLEELRLLCPLCDRVGAAEVLAGLGLVLGPRLGIFDEVLAHDKQQVIAVVDHHVELVVVILLILEAIGDTGEVRLVLLGQIVEWDDDLGTHGIRHGVGKVVEDIVDTRLGHRLLHDLGGNVGVAERYDLELDAGQLFPLLGENRLITVSSS